MPEKLPELDSTRLYVDALQKSSDGARRVLYVVIVVTVLIFSMNYNIQPNNWSRRRLATWYSYARSDTPNRQLPKYVAGGDEQRLIDLRKEYAKQFVDRAVITTWPLTGMAIDVNELGTIGGIALMLLMATLLICVAREHENLHLALYKVRMLAMEEGPLSINGDSRSNLLYHALAMSQVLNSPPTLARWHPPGGFSIFRLIFLAPFFVYAWVVSTDWASRETARAYGVDVERILAMEAVIAFALFILGVFTWVHSSAMADRWANAFFSVNPHRAQFQQSSLFTWVRIRIGRKPQTSGHLITSLIDATLDSGLRSARVLIMPNVIENVENRATREQVAEMARRITACGETAASLKCIYERLGTYARLAHFQVGASRFEDERWSVSGVWTFLYRPNT